MDSDSIDLPECPYGIKCYRQNPKHFAEYSHPVGHKRVEPADGVDSVATPSSSSVTMNTPAVDAPPRKRAKLDAGDPLNSPTKSPRSAKKSHTDPSRLEVSRLGLYLTTARGIDAKYNDPALTRSMKDLLAPGMGNLQSSIQFNYMFDIPWFMEQYPPEFRDKPVLIVHGYSASSSGGKELRQDASKYPNITLAMARLPMQYGTHHTKMMILRYDTGLRVVVHTSNLLSGDWNNKTQGIWISPVFPRSSPADSETNFRADLVEYLRSYNVPTLTEISNQLLEYDMSAARVCIVASTPGRHMGPKKSAYGHLKLRALLTKHCTAIGSDWPVIAQFSSIGSLGSTASNWLTAEFLESLSSPISGLMVKPPLNCIFPSVDNVRLSLEGWRGGGSLPYSEDTANKQRYLDKFLHMWKSSNFGRTNNMPHIKSFTRISPDLTECAWFLVTSSNLSKAAWGALEKDSSQLMIRSYELGVLFLPKFFQPDAKAFPIAPTIESIKSEEFLELGIFLPYELPLTGYNKTDKPWTWNAPQTGLKDRFGKSRRETDD